MENKNIILLGAPGSGKGTISKQLVDTYKHIAISTGDILREEKNSGTELGNKIKDIIGKGNLVSDEIVNIIVKNKLEKINSSFILDGFPRTIAQAEYLDTITNIDLIIYIKASDETITKRILERGKTSGREDDLSEDIIKKRITQFKEETQPLYDFYHKTGKLIVLNGEESPLVVFDEYLNIIGGR